jgi:aldose 1-epimerase
MDLVELCDGGAQAVVAPEIGGALAAFRSRRGDETVDWLRPASRAAIAGRDASGMACFPLVPYSNRIRSGRFAFGGRDVALPVTAQDPHFEHGHGWRAPWTVEAQGRAHIVLSYRHAADAWPWPYQAHQHIALADGALTLSIAIRNLADEPMPAGFGLHPYFPATPETELGAELDAMWETDAEMLPTRLVPLSPDALPIRVAKVGLDNVFTGWRQRATIRWPEQDAALDLTADGPLDFLVMYTPPGERFFCAEPVSNATDALNSPLAPRAAGAQGSGTITLAPGASAAATVRFVPRPILSHPPTANQRGFSR